LTRTSSASIIEHRHSIREELFDTNARRFRRDVSGPAGWRTILPSAISSARNENSFCRQRLRAGRLVDVRAEVQRSRRALEARREKERDGESWGTEEEELRNGCTGKR